MLTMLMMMAPRNACPKPGTVLRWGLLFISGVFVPLVEMPRPRAHWPTSPH
jgi:hypothetical protein